MNFWILNRYLLFYFHKSIHTVDVQSQYCTNSGLDNCNAQFRRIMDRPKKTV